MEFGKESTLTGVKGLEVKKLSQQKWQCQQLGLFNMEKALGTLCGLSVYEGGFISKMERDPLPRQRSRTRGSGFKPKDGSFRWDKRKHLLG